MQNNKPLIHILHYQEIIKKVNLFTLLEHYKTILTDNFLDMISKKLLEKHDDNQGIKFVILDSANMII